MKSLRSVFASLLLLGLLPLSLLAQPPEEKKNVDPAGKAEAVSKSPEKVEVTPVARDDEIADRLVRILKATEWFQDPEVSVNEGVVFLKGRTTDEPFKKWAGDLARNTRDVVAVVNQITVDSPPVWDSTGVKSQLNELGRYGVSALPIIAFALVVLTLAYFISKLVTRLSQRLLQESIGSDLLRRVAARAFGLLVFVIAIYLVLQVAGLTRLALTILGGTGVLGLALGIAFKEITENFLASIYLSIQKPFSTGDLVEITGQLGFVQSVTARTTILMTLDGNHVQIPNAIVFKNTLRNFTSNPNRRVDFTIGVGFSVDIAQAQEVAIQVLRDHPAVLKDPEPWVLVDNVGPSTVNLRIYFWLDGKQHSWLKVISAVIRLTKSAFQDAGIISVPNSSQQIVFPSGVPVHILDRVPEVEKPDDPEDAKPSTEPAASAAEGGLSSVAGEIEQQAKKARMPEAGENLIEAKPPEPEPPAAPPVDVKPA